jgi:hypothetical protein
MPTKGSVKRAIWRHGKDGTGMVIDPYIQSHRITPCPRIVVECTHPVEVTLTTHILIRDMGATVEGDDLTTVTCCPLTTLA